MEHRKKEGTTNLQKTIDKLMTEKGITNKELAVLTGLHVKTIREIRSGVVKARYSSLRKIYKVLQAERNGVGG